jgi:hypothetical protein
VINLKKTPQNAGFFDGPNGNLGRLNIRRLLTFGALHNIETYFLTFLEGFKTSHLNSRKMSEDIFSATIWGNKTITLGIVKPLDYTSCHLSDFLQKNKLIQSRPAEAPVMPPSCDPPEAVCCSHTKHRTIFVSIDAEVKLQCEKKQFSSV